MSDELRACPRNSFTVDARAGKGRIMRKTKPICPLCKENLRLPGNEYGQIAAECPKCRRTTKFYYPEDSNELIDELKGWDRGINDDEI